MSEEPEENYEEESETPEVVSEPTDLSDEIPPELRETYEHMKEEGTSRLDIVREILREDVNTSPVALSKLSGIPVKRIWALKGGAVRYLQAHPRETSEPPSSAAERVGQSQTARKKVSPYKSGADINQILYDILKDHPDIKSGQITEVMSWAKMTQGGLHPAHLYSLLLSFKGIDSRIASMLSQKYTLAVNKAQQEQQIMGQQPMPGIGWGSFQQQTFQQPPTIFPGQMPLSVPFPQQQQFTGQPQVPSGYFRKEDVDRMLKEQKTATDLENLKSSMARLRDDIPRMIRDNVPQTGQTEYEVIEIPVDANGNICSPEEAKSIKKITRPASAEKEDFFDKLIKLKKAGVLREEILTEEKMRAIVKEGTPTTSPELADVKNKLESQERKYEELKDKMSDEDKKRMQDTMNELRTQVSALNTRLSSSGVNSPEGVMATAITEASKHAPVKDIVMGVKEILNTAGPVPPAPGEVLAAGQEQRSGVLEALRPHNLVTTVRERMRGK